MDWQVITRENISNNEQDLLISMLNLETGKEFIDVGCFIEGRYKSFSECGDAEVVPIAFCEMPKCFLESQNINPIEVAKVMKLLNK